IIYFYSVTFDKNHYFKLMKIIGFIARRYLFSKKYFSLMSSLTVLSIAGVTICTARLIIVLSVFNGFFSVIKGYLLKNDPDIRIELAEGKTFLYTKELQNNISELPDVQVQAPYMSGKALLVNKKEGKEVVTVKGIKSSNYFKINNLTEYINRGM